MKSRTLTLMLATLCLLQAAYAQTPTFDPPTIPDGDNPFGPSPFCSFCRVTLNGPDTVFINQPAVYCASVCPRAWKTEDFKYAKLETQYWLSDVKFFSNGSGTSNNNPGFFRESCDTITWGPEAATCQGSYVKVEVKWKVKKKLKSKLGFPIVEWEEEEKCSDEIKVKFPQLCGAYRFTHQIECQDDQTLYRLFYEFGPDGGEPFVYRIYVNNSLFTTTTSNTPVLPLSISETSTVCVSRYFTNLNVESEKTCQTVIPPVFAFISGPTQVNLYEDGHYTLNVFNNFNLSNFTVDWNIYPSTGYKKTFESGNNLSILEFLAEGVYEIQAVFDVCGTAYQETIEVCVGNCISPGTDPTVTNRGESSGTEARPLVINQHSAITVNLPDDHADGEFLLALVHASGQTLESLRVKGNTARLDMTNHPSGIYFIQVVDFRGNQTTEKIFKP